MGFENMGQLPDPNMQYQRYSQQNPFAASKIDDTSTSNNKQIGADDKEATQPRSIVRAPSSAQYQEQAYQEHVSGPIFLNPAEAPNFRPVHQPYQPPVQNQYRAIPQYPPMPTNPVYPGYQGTQSYPGQQPFAGYNNHTPQYLPYGGYQGNYGYPSYAAYGTYTPYASAWQPAPPRRDGYQFGVSIVALVCAVVVGLTGLICLLLFSLFAIIPTTGNYTPKSQLEVVILFMSFAIAGVVGGGFGIYHCIRALMQRPSTDFKLPQFWIFLALYIGVIAIAVTLTATGQAVSNTALTIFLISLAAILPAFTIAALGVRRIHFPTWRRWPTSWRRFTLAMVSGATLAVLLALIFEFILQLLAIQEFRGVAVDNIDQQIPTDPRAIALLFVLVSVIAPLVEEAVKPLGVVVLIGRINSAAEAFVLGLGCGIGFNLIETSGYISMGYNDWVTVALERSSAGLLHGFGAGMIALGWYYLTHSKSSPRRFQLAAGCIAYAVLQHAIWNGSFLLAFLPSPIGPYLSTGTINLGPLTFDAVIIVYVIETALMLLFFFFVTDLLRKQQPPTTGQQPVGARQAQPVPAYERQMPAQA